MMKNILSLHRQGFRTLSTNRSLETINTNVKTTHLLIKHASTNSLSNAKYRNLLAVFPAMRI